MGSSNLRARLDRMSRALRPLFVNVTWGAGGSTAVKSLELAELCQRELGLTTCLHLTCTNMSKELVDGALEDARSLGIRNILALRGDPPRGEEYGVDTNGDGVEFVWAIDLVRYIRKRYGDYFCIGVAAYPEGHADEADPAGQSLEHDLPYLVEKVQAGADFIMTQLFFDVQAYDAFVKRLREHESGAFKSLPIIPGMMPIQSYQMIKRTTKLSHATLPNSIMARLDNVRGDDEMVKKVGVDILSEIVEHIKEHPIHATEGGKRGFHFYTLNLEKAVSFILERTNLIPPLQADDEIAILDPLPNGIAVQTHKRSGRRLNSVGSDPHNRVIITAPETEHPDFEATAEEAAILAEPINTRANTLAISEGEGALGTHPFLRPVQLRLTSALIRNRSGSNLGRFPQWPLGRRSLPRIRRDRWLRRQSAHVCKSSHQTLGLPHFHRLHHRPVPQTHQRRDLRNPLVRRRPQRRIHHHPRPTLKTKRKRLVDGSQSARC